MSQEATQLTYLRDPRIAPHALSARPAWLWATDGARILWANAAGAACFDTESPLALTQRRFDKGMPITTSVARIADSLVPGHAPRLERLRGLGEGFAPTTCSCLHIDVGDVAGVLIVGLKATASGMPRSERIARLMHGIGEPVALFSADGHLLHAAHPAAERLAAATTLSFLGLSSLAADALRAGHADGSGKAGTVVMERINAGDGALLLATFGQQPTPLELNSHEAPAIAAHDPQSAERAAQENIQEDIQENVQDGIHDGVEEGERHEAHAERPDHADIAAAEAVSDHAGDAVAVPDAADDPASAQQQDSVQDSFQDLSQESAPDQAQEFAQDSSQDLVQDSVHELASKPIAESAQAPAHEPPEDRPTSPAPSTDPHYPVRFVWQMDAAGHFTIRSDEFIALVGPATEDVLGETWQQINTRLAIDPEDRVAHSIATRGTWSGIHVDWPIDGTQERIAVELSGLPIFERDRLFSGYRGFGVCRDVFERPATATSAVSSRPHIEPPVFTIAASTANVVPFKSANGDRAASLSPVERNAFQELARQLTTRLQEGSTIATLTPGITADADAPDRATAGARFTDARFAVTAHRRGTFAQDLIPILERMPCGVLVYRLENLLFANAAFLRWSGYSSLSALVADGGLDALFVAPLTLADATPSDPRPETYSVSTARGGGEAARAALTRISWDDEDARMLTLAETVPAPDDMTDMFADLLVDPPVAPPTDPPTDLPTAPSAELAASGEERAELQAIVDAAADGIVVIDHQGRIVSANPGAEWLFGVAADALQGRSFDSLLAPESRVGALTDFNRMIVDSISHHDGREVVGHTLGDAMSHAPRADREIPLFMTLGRIALHPVRLCAIFRDVSLWKNAERELVAARHETDRAVATKSDFLAKISHEVRTPLNAIIGFSEVMMSERFGAIGNERYHAYLRDIHASGNHVLGLLNDLLDLSKIEAGRIDLTFASMNLNALTQTCVALVQPQAIKERIIIRMALAPTLPAIVADARSVRQIILNLLTNSLRLTSAGGQIIVSTAMTDNGGGVLRVRDTGAGMSEREVAMALEPFRQLSTPLAPEQGGNGLGLPLTKALAEANRANFTITSAPNAGTLIEIAFPPARAAAE